MTEADLEKFLSWCKERGMKFDDIEIRSAGEGAGYGVFAKRNFRPEEKLIQISDEFMITGGKVADMERYSDIADRADPALTPGEMLCVFFALEDSEDSEWGPYFKMLPASFDTPAYHEMDIDIEELPKSVRGYYDIQQQELSALFAKIGALLPEISRQKLLWAWHVVNTRCIYNENRLHPKLMNQGGDTFVIVPLIDMINHSNEYKCVFNYDKVNHQMVVKANGTVMEDCEAFFCYGPHSNARLWMEYGFTLPNNQHTKVELDNGLLIALAGRVGETVSAEHIQAINESGFIGTIYKTDEGPSWQLLTLIKLLLLDRESVGRWRVYATQNNDSFDLDDDDRELKRRIHELLERIVVEMRTAMENRINRAPQALKWLWEEELGVVDMVIEKARAVIAELAEDED